MLLKGGPPTATEDIFGLRRAEVEALTLLIHQDPHAKDEAVASLLVPKLEGNALLRSQLHIFQKVSGHGQKKTTSKKWCFGNLKNNNNHVFLPANILGRVALPIICSGGANACYSTIRASDLQGADNNSPPLQILSFFRKHIMFKNRLFHA